MAPASTIAATMLPLVRSCARSFARSPNDHSRSTARWLVRTRARLPRARMRWRRLCEDGGGCERLLLTIDESQRSTRDASGSRVAAALSKRASTGGHFFAFDGRIYGNKRIYLPRHMMAKAIITLFSLIVR